VNKNLLYEEEKSYVQDEKNFLEKSVQMKDIEVHATSMEDQNSKVIHADINTQEKIFTTLVRIKGAQYNVVPVKSNKPIHMSLWIDCSKALSRLYVGAPIKIGDIVCKNILNTGVDIVCTRNVEKAKDK
jgi:CxxC motif-containing protein